MIQRKHHSATKARIKIIFIIFIVAILQVPCAAQEQFVSPAAKYITGFPFTQLTGGIIIIEAQLDNIADTLNFVLDTGSGGISLDSTTVDYFHLPSTPSERTVKGIGGIRKVNFINDRTLHLPGISVQHLNFHVNDYELLTSVYGIKIDGIIGYSFFQRYVVKINYDSNKIEVWQPGKTKYPRGGFLMKPTINGIPMIDARIRDASKKNGTFYFDTGAGLCFLMSEDYERDSSILKKDKKIIVTQVEGMGGKKPMKMSMVNEVKVGPFRFKKVPVYIFKDEYQITSYPLLGGIIGNDLLRRFNLVVNYNESEIFMTPNSHYFDPFDYSYTGLGIYMIDGQVQIQDVIKDSPGEKAGLKPGDIILAINNNVGKNIQVYKTLLQNVGATLKMVILRNGTPVETFLRVKNILR